MDAQTRQEAADDFGHIVHHTPWAVLVPGSVQDIVKMVRFARANHLKIAAARGIGESHSTQGQSQVLGGIVIDMSALSTIHEVGATSAWVDAGVRWIELLQVTVPQGKSPPVLTDYIELSVGGTLSVGGIGGQAFRWGLQVDNVLELDVVTGRGDLVRCSPYLNRALFDAVRGGLGQFGIIVRARVRLVAVPPLVRVYTAFYSNVHTFRQDQERLIEEGRFDYVEGFVVPGTTGGWSYQLEVAKYYAPGSEPNDALLLAGLSYTPGTLTTQDTTYFNFANRLAPLVELLKSLGVWYFPHPWLNMFVPQPVTDAFVQLVLAETPPSELGQGPVILYPFKSSRLTAPFVRVPPTPHVFLFALLRTAIPPTPENVAYLVAKNRLIYEQLRAVGGKRYPVDSVPMTHPDWALHFDAYWALFAYYKHLFDPDKVLTPGQHIF
jgi:FAD/FMN-containing dehydrogenase